MSWIETVDAKAATGRLREIHDRIAGPEGAIDHVLQTHSLRSHTLEGLARKAGDDYSKTRLTPRAKNIFHWLYERARR